MKYTCPTRTLPLRTQRELHSTGLCWGSCWVDRGSRWVDWGSGWVDRGSCWVRKAFWIPTCWYRHHEPLALGAVPNTNTQASGFALQLNIGLRVYGWIGKRELPETNNCNRFISLNHILKRLKNHLSTERPNCGWNYLLTWDKIKRWIQICHKKTIRSLKYQLLPVSLRRNYLLLENVDMFISHWSEKVIN